MRAAFIYDQNTDEVVRWVSVLIRYYFNQLIGLNFIIPVEIWMRPWNKKWVKNDVEHESFRALNML